GSGGELSRTPSVVAYAGTDPDVIAAEDTSIDRQKADREVPTYLFIGKGFRTKGLNVLLEACRLLSSRKKQFRLLVAGAKPRLLDLITLAFCGLEQRVTYLGYVSDLDRAFKESDIFVMPSRMETFGIACIQAMQRGLAPIVSRVAGASELLV